jgi:hypothetical protein
LGLSTVILVIISDTNITFGTTLIFRGLLASIIVTACFGQIPMQRVSITRVSWRAAHGPHQPEKELPTSDLRMVIFTRRS